MEMRYLTGFPWQIQKIKNILLDSNSGLTTAKLHEMNEKAQEVVNKVINSAGGVEQWNAYHEVKEIQRLGVKKLRKP
ncbi:MAG: hypothetical protein R3E93_11240 [Thiothrix sp.]